MARASHPSAKSRISVPQTAMVAAKRKLRGLWRGRGGGLSDKLPSRRPGRFHPAKPALTLGNPDITSELLAGRFAFAGQVLDVGMEGGDLGSPWTIASPSRRFADWLHGFDWLPDLLAQDSEVAETRAQALVDGWIETYGRGNEFAWESERLARRLFHWLSLWSPALSQAADMDHAESVLERRRASVLRQLTVLRQNLKSLPPGLPRLVAGAALAMGGARLTDQGKAQFLERGLDLLDSEIPLQILPDGGHISRSPDMTAQALRVLLTLDSLLADRGVAGSGDLSRAIDRLAPMVASFRRTGGELAAFQGGGENLAADIAELLSVAPGEPKPFSYGPHSGYQRLAAGGQIILIDTGSAPQHPFDTRTHLAPLAMDLSTVEGPMIVNCGYSGEQPLSWARPLRAAAAHSTLVLDGRSPGRLLEKEWMRRTLGDAVEAAPGPVRASRKEQESGIWLEASHEGYMGDYGLSHRRRLFIPKDGHDIRGEDCLFAPAGTVPIRKDAVPFALRFHVHPSVRVSLSQDQSSALLVVGGKAGWRFRTDGGRIAIEDSVYLGTGHAPVKTQQIVIRGEAFCDSDGESRSNRVRWSFRRLKARTKPTVVETAPVEGDSL